SQMQTCRHPGLNSRLFAFIRGLFGHPGPCLPRPQSRGTLNRPGARGGGDPSRATGLVKRPSMPDPRRALALAGLLLAVVVSELPAAPTNALRNPPRFAIDVWDSE